MTNCLLSSNKRQKMLLVSLREGHLGLRFAAADFDKIRSCAMAATSMLVTDVGDGLRW